MEFRDLNFFKLFPILSSLLLLCLNCVQHYKLIICVWVQRRFMSRVCAENLAGNWAAHDDFILITLRKDVWKFNTKPKNNSSVNSVKAMCWLVLFKFVEQNIWLAKLTMETEDPLWCSQIINLILANEPNDKKTLECNASELHALISRNSTCLWHRISCLSIQVTTFCCEIATFFTLILTPSIQLLRRSVIGKVCDYWKFSETQYTHSMQCS